MPDAGGRPAEDAGAEDDVAAAVEDDDESLAAVGDATAASIGLVAYPVCSQGYVTPKAAGLVVVEHIELLGAGLAGGAAQ